MKILYLSCPAKIDVIPALKKNLAKLKGYSKIALLTTAQFLPQLKNIKKLLKENNLEILIGKPKHTAIAKGQILGCDISAGLAVEKESDCFLYIGTGEFHPLGLALYTNKPILILNPYTQILTEISLEEKNKILKQKILKLAKLKEAKNIGILASIKPGQYELQEKIIPLKEKLEKQNKKVYLFVADNIADIELQNFMFIDLWINTACPRLIEDHFSKPIINAIMLKSENL
ncbi:MAG: diphthamide synthesis protein [Candidatus Nanoarchaeia archaeon]